MPSSSRGEREAAGPAQHPKEHDLAASVQEAHTRFVSFQYTHRDFENELGISFIAPRPF